MTTQLNSLTAEIYDSSSIVFYFNGNYDTISLYKSTNKGISYSLINDNISLDHYTLLNLPNNIFYTFKAEPYDIYNISGEALITNIFLNYDLEITKFYYEKLTETSILLTWEGNYQAVNIQYKLSIYDDFAYTDYISIIGTNTRVFTDLDENVEYTFKITPKFFSGIISDTSNIITCSTSLNPYISNFSIKEMYDYKVKFNFDGYYSLIKFQYSLFKNSGYKTLAILNYNDDISGSHIFSGLSAYTTYYFRAIPYNSYFILGDKTIVISGKTLPGIKSFLRTTSSQTSNTIFWNGTYKALNLYKSIDGGNTYSFLQKFSNEVEGIYSDTYIDTNLTSNTEYYYYIQPSINNIYGISYEINISTNYDATISFNITEITTDSITVYINPSGSLFTKALIQVSKDNSFYYDITYIYQNGINYTINDLCDNSINDYVYYVKITPFGLYDISGTLPLTKDIRIEGEVIIIDLSSNIYSDIYIFNDEDFYNDINFMYSINYSFPYNYTSITDSSYYIINSLEIEVY